MSNNYDGKIIIDTEGGYFGFVRVGDESTGPRIYVFDNIGEAAGTAAPMGSLAMCRDATTIRNTDGNATWELIGAGGSGGEEIATVIAGESADLEAEATANIAYDIPGGDTFNQTLPLVSTSTRKKYRFQLSDESSFVSVTFVATGGDTILGKDTMDSSSETQIDYIHDGVSRWVRFGPNFS